MVLAYSAEKTAGICTRTRGRTRYNALVSER